MRHITAYLSLAVLLAGCDSPAQPESVGVTPRSPELFREHVGEVVRQPVSFVVNGCSNGELVTVTGEELHVFSLVGPDVASGNFPHLMDFVKISATGVGESGTQYIFNMAERFTFESPSDEAQHVALTFHGGDILVTKGADGDFIGHFTFHLVDTANGFEIVTTFEKAECRG